jgi:phage gpG-like protein
MSGPLVETKVVGAREAEAALLEIAVRGGDVIPVSEEIRAICRASAERRFETAGLGTWPPWSPNTTTHGASLLRASGELYRSLTAEQADEQIDRRLPTELHFGSKVPYAFFHDRGTKWMPRRELVHLTPAEQVAIKRVVEPYVAKGLP